MIRKKWIAVWLSVLLMCTCLLPVGATVFSDMEGDKNEKPVQLLSEIGIIKGKTETEYTPLESLTRAEMTTILLRLINMENKTSVGLPVFSDVSAEHWAYHNIMTAYEMKLVNGTSETTFEPDAPVTYAQTVKLLVTLLGYGVKAEALGGYPAGYLITASQLELLQGVAVQDAEPLTRGEMARLVYNALEIKLFDKEGYGADANQYNTVEDTILTRYLNISHYKAKVAATYMGEIATPIRRLAKNEIYFENVAVTNAIPMTSFIAAADTPKEADYLGAVCDVYVKEDAKEEVDLLAVFPRESTSIITVDAADILKDTTKTEFYYMVGDKEYKIQIDGAMTVYNGQVKNVTAEELAPDVGTVRLISNNRGGDYDTIIIESYKDYLVDNINYENGTIYFTGGGFLTLDSADKELSIELRDASGKEIALFDFYPQDILSIAENGKYRKVYRSDKVVEGVITEEANDYVIINGEKYEVARALHNAQQLQALEMGIKSIFSLDFTGKIAAVEKKRSYMYGYLVGAQAVGGLNKEPFLKIFTEDGKMVVYNVAKRVQLNEESVSKTDILHESKANEIWDGAKVVQGLLRYEINEKNELIKIETATDYTKNPAAAENGESFTLDYYFDKNGHLASKDGSIVYRKDVQFVGGDLSTFVGRIAPRTNTKIFVIPEEGASDEAYSMTTYGMFEHNMEYPDLEFYDTGENFVPGAMVYYQKGAGSGNEYPTYHVEHALVQKIYTGMSTHGEVGCMLDVYTTNGLKKQVYVEEDFRALYKAANANIEKDIYWYTSKGSDGKTTRKMPAPGEKRGDMFMDAEHLQIGDIIQIETDTTGKATMISVKYRAGEFAANVLTGGTSDVSVLDAYNYYSSGLSVMEYVRFAGYGFIAEGQLADAAGRPNGETAEFFFPTSKNCLLVDKKTGEVSKISVEEIYPGDVVVKIAVTYTIKAYFVYRDWY